MYHKNRDIQLIINTSSGKLSKYGDSYIRKSGVKYKVAYIITLAAAMAVGRGIEAYQSYQGSVKLLQGYHMDISPPSADQGGNNQWDQ